MSPARTPKTRRSTVPDRQRIRPGIQRHQIEKSVPIELRHTSADRRGADGERLGGRENAAGSAIPERDVLIAEVDRREIRVTVAVEVRRDQGQRFETGGQRGPVRESVGRAPVHGYRLVAVVHEGDIHAAVAVEIRQRRLPRRLAGAESDVRRQGAAGPIQEDPRAGGAHDHQVGAAIHIEVATRQTQRQRIGRHGHERGSKREPGGKCRRSGGGEPGQRDESGAHATEKGDTCGRAGTDGRDSAHGYPRTGGGRGGAAGTDSGCREPHDLLER
jgi:hypothetical protein